MSSSPSSISVIVDLIVNTCTPDWTKIQELISQLDSTTKNELITNVIDIEYGRYLIHYALWEKAPTNFVIELITNYPYVVEQKDKEQQQQIGGWYPLHYACRHYPYGTVVQLLITKYPDACNVQDIKGYSPFHLACYNNHLDVTIFQLLLTEYPLAMEIKTMDDQQYSLHIACYSNQSESVIQFLITKFPTACQVKDKKRRTPLHLACRYTYSVAVLQLLISHYPKACEEKDKTGLYPLNIAYQGNQSESVLRLLVSTYPKACSKKDKKGFYPLHMECRRNGTTNNDNRSSEESLLQLILLQYPSACKRKANDGTDCMLFDGSYPLHIACEYPNNSVSVIQSLVKIHPKAVKTKKGWDLPLHLALLSNCNNESVIHYLIEQYPTACTIKNYYGNYPVHLACGKKHSESIITKLIETYPKAIRMKLNPSSYWSNYFDENYYFINYPLHYACQNNTNLSVSVFHLLINKFPRALDEKSSTPDGMYPIHVACANNASLNIIQTLIRYRPNSIRYKTSGDNLTPLDIAKNLYKNNNKSNANEMSRPPPNAETVDWLEKCLNDGIDKMESVQDLIKGG